MQLDPVTRYASEVVDGKVLAGRMVRLACERHLRDMEHGHKRGLHWHPEQAERRINFFRDVLCLAEGEHAGNPFILTPWQEFVVGSLFGWFGDDGFRRFRTAYVEVGKGNGKSPLAGGIGLSMLCADGEIGAYCYAAATTREQASILFQDAVKMVDASPALTRRILKSGNRQVFNLAHQATGSYFRPVSSEGRGLDGKRVHYAALDEIHEHPSDVVVNKMRAGTKGRRQALIFEITNSGYNRNSVCFHHHEYSEKILTGVLEDDSWFAYVCQLDTCDKCRAEGKVSPSCDKCDQWTDERVWIKVNPNLGVSIQPKYLREQVREAQGMPSKENIVKRLNFCIWTEGSVKWMPMDAWDSCGLDQVAPELLAGHRCFGGLDLSSTTDIASFALIFPDDGNAVMSFNWIPKENTAQRIKRDRVPYDVWQRQGLIEFTEGNVIDFRAIRKKIKELGDKYQIQQIGYDPWNATQLATELQDEDGFVMAKVRQGTWDMNDPSKSLETKIKHGELRHGGNSLLRWSASNVAMKVDPSGLIRPDKEKSTEKIDPAVALIIANGRADANPLDSSSVYESRGILTL